MELWGSMHYIAGKGKPFNKSSNYSAQENDVDLEFSTMLAWTQENVWNQVLLDRGINGYVVWTGLKIILPDVVC